ncbi:hypothetical protein [Bradyrhizobium sp. S69]|uniref:hypothetical protein n=1 Tax=Bradyrhizobium sp. S69 TaxID=1641856 RepID=UPI00131A7135|nr:hypothetical protein [Bradyrhizobium sp. S69]
MTYFDNATIVFFGALGPMFGTFAWYANVFLFVATVRLALGRAPWLLSDLAGLALALTSFRIVELMHNEAFSEPVCAWGIGFWLWLACFVIVLGISLGNAIAWAFRPSPTPLRHDEATIE